MTGSLTEQSNYKVIKLAEQRYELLARIEVGATAIVWKARLIGEQEDVPDSSTVDYEFLQTKYLDQDVAGLGDGRIAPDNLMALKVPRDDSERDGLLEEGKRLALLNSRNVPGIVKLKYDYFSYPCLALAWAQGQKLSDFKPSDPEAEGLRIATKLAAIIRATFNAGIFLTDTMKPDSVFWEPETETVTLIDFGIVGNLQDTESKTMPYFGNTLHRVFTGEQPITNFGAGPIVPERFGEPHRMWSALSGGTRRIIRRLFTDKYLDEPIERIAPRDQFSTLLRAIGRMDDDIRDQSTNWVKPVGDLRSELRKAQGADAVNLLDILRAREGRSGRELTSEEEAILREAWQKVALDELAGRERGKIEYMAARHEMAVAHDLYKTDANIHRAYLLLEAAESAPATPAWWQDAAPVVEQMERGDMLAARNDYAAATEAYDQAAAVTGQPATDPETELPSWLRAEAVYLAEWARLQAELASQPWDAREPAVSDRNRRLEELERMLTGLRQGTPWPEFRDRYQGEYNSLREKTNSLYQEAKGELDTLNKLLDQGKINDAERRLESLGERFLLETGHIERALRHGHATANALREVLAAKTAESRAKALDAALKGFEEAKDITAPAGTERERADVVHLTLQFLLGRAALDRYTEALEWLERLQKVAPTDLPDDIDDIKKKWRSKSEHQGRHFPNGKLPRGTEDLERAIKNEFFFAPDLSLGLHSELAAKYKGDDRLYIARDTYAATPDIEAVRARVSKLDPSPWLAADEEEALRKIKKNAGNSAQTLMKQIERLRRDFRAYDLVHAGNQSDSDLITRASLLSAPDSDEKERNKLTDVLLERAAAGTTAPDKALFYLGLAKTIAPEAERVSKAQDDRLYALRKDEKGQLSEQLEEERRRIDQQLFDRLQIDRVVGTLTILLHQAQTLTPETGSDTAWDNLARLLDELQNRVDMISGQRQDDSYWRDYHTETLEPQLSEIRGAVAVYKEKRLPQVVADIAAGKISPEPAQPAVERKLLSREDLAVRYERQQKVKEPAHIIHHTRNKVYSNARRIVDDIPDAEFRRLREIKDRGANGNDGSEEQGEG